MSGASDGRGGLRGSSRRAVLVGGASLLLPASLGRVASAGAAEGGPADEHGRVTSPLAPPDLPVVCHDGTRARLRALVRGRVTALHPMFTSCTATCPIQGAVLAKVQKLLPDRAARGIQLISLSIDPQRDSPQALRAWLARFHAGPGWLAAAPADAADVPAVRAFTGPGKNAGDPHTTRVLILDRQGLLVWRTFDLPDAAEIADVLRKV